MEEALFTVGKIVNTHGIRGELKVVTQTDFPEIRFKPKSRLVLQHPEQTRQTLDVVVESSKTHKQMYLVKLKQFDDINEVEQYKGWLLKVRKSDLAELEENEYYYYEIVGCAAVTEEGEELGVITEILQPGANDVWVVQRKQGKPLLLPYIEQVIKHVDVAEKRVTVHLLEGLME